VIGRTYVLRDAGVRERFKAFVDELPQDQLWEVTVSRYNAKSSAGQMGKWHAMIGEIARATGNDPAAVKDFLKNEFGPKREVVIHGECRVVPKSSTQYSAEEMSEMIDRTTSWAAHELQLFV
jgi:hypothetical protein